MIQRQYGSVWVAPELEQANLLLDSAGKRSADDAEKVLHALLGIALFVVGLGPYAVEAVLCGGEMTTGRVMIAPASC